MCKHNLYVGLGSYEVYRMHMHFCIVKKQKNEQKNTDLHYLWEVKK